MSHFAVNEQYGSFSSFGNLWSHIGCQNVTGPPWALRLIETRDCIEIITITATLGIYYTDFMRFPVTLDITSKITHAVHSSEQQVCSKSIYEKHVTSKKQHFQRRYASTELQINELNDWH